MFGIRRGLGGSEEAASQNISVGAAVGVSIKKQAHLRLEDCGYHPQISEDLQLAVSVTDSI